LEQLVFYDKEYHDGHKCPADLGHASREFCKLQSSVQRTEKVWTFLWQSANEIDNMLISYKTKTD